MQAGQMYDSGIQAVANNGYLDARPVASSNEIQVQNIYSEGAVELYWYDGTTLLGKFDSTAGATDLPDLRFRCSYSVYLRVKNVAGSQKNMRVDGVYTWPR